MRVLAVGNMYPPHHLGGYELVWRSATEHLRARGHEVAVLTTDFRRAEVDEPDPSHVRRELRWWWRDHGWPVFSARERFAIERHNARVLDKALAETAPDVVAWWSMGGMSLSLVERARRAGLPAVGFVHDDWLVYGPAMDAWLRMWRRAGRLAPDSALGVPTRFDPSRAARWVFVSASTRERVAELGGWELADTGIAHSGIGAAFLSPQAQRPWAWRLLYVGRIDARKGIGTAIEALAELPAEAVLDIVGTGEAEEEARLRATAERLGVNVRFAGVADRAGLRAAYTECDAVVFPVTWEEPWGLVPLEAMGMGRPVVATGRGGSGEYLRPWENCLLFPPGDASALAAALVRLAADEELRERLRAGGAATAPLHTEEIFNRRVEEELSACARGAPGGAP